MIKSFQDGNSFLSIEIYDGIQLCIYVNWRTALWEFELCHKTSRFKTNLFDNQLINLKRMEKQLNENMLKILDILDELRQSLILFTYCHAADLLGLNYKVNMDTEEGRNHSLNFSLKNIR